LKVIILKENRFLQVYKIWGFTIFEHFASKITELHNTEYSDILIKLDVLKYKNKQGDQIKKKKIADYRLGEIALKISPNENKCQNIYIKPRFFKAKIYTSNLVLKLLM